MENYIQGIKVALSGVGTTVSITVVAVIIGICIGLVVAICKISKKKPLRIIASIYVEILRGTPMLVQALILYNGLPMFLQSFGIMFKWEYPIVAGMIVCGVNSSAYVAEIIRSGLQAVDKGQTEAARSLGMSNLQT
ncbi:MAG: ABC transporter permease subunit, partial [Anaerovoracaceae bacterium]